MWLSIVLEIAFSKTLPSGGFLIKTKIGKAYLGKTAKGHHFEVSGGDSQSKTADGQDFEASGLNRQHESWPKRTTTPSSWPKDPQDTGPHRDDQYTGLKDDLIQKAHAATTTTTTTTPTTTTTTPPTTPGWTETTTTKDSWPPRTTTSAGKGWVHWTKMIKGHHYL